MTIDEAEGLIDEYVQTFNYTKVLSRDDAYRIVTKIVNGLQPEIEKLKLENGQMSARIEFELNRLLEKNQ